uniref:Topoisomerase I n=1 Tax=Strongyloides papillosus TaxID=174720 RepID=A0A0N5CIU2_STREA
LSQFGMNGDNDGSAQQTPKNLSLPPASFEDKNEDELATTPTGDSKRKSKKNKKGKGKNNKNDGSNDNLFEMTSGEDDVKPDSPKPTTDKSSSKGQKKKKKQKGVKSASKNKKSNEKRTNKNKKNGKNHANNPNLDGNLSDEISIGETGKYKIFFKYNE